MLRVLKMRLEAEGYFVTTVPESNEAIEVAKEEIFDLAVIDLKLGKKNGIELMESLHRIQPDIPVIILTAYGTIESAVDAMKRGAYSYLTKPFDHRELILQIKNGIEKASLSKEVKRLKHIVEERYEFKNIIGESEKMKKVLELVSRAAEIDSNVYIEGESGTGKELIAKALHLASPRKNGPFVAINCAAIPETLLESELFGFKKGAFTGAFYTKKGIFSQADGGSIFLDEISEMPLSMQAKLLRVIEEKEFYPVGSERSIKVDVRIIAASNKDLEEEVKKGRFRNDLFYRIHVIPIKLPPLRERKEDIPLLAKHFLKKFSEKMKKDIKGFSLGAIKKMMLYNWPGNVRELENMIECAVAMSTKDIITEELILSTQTLKEDIVKPLKEAKDEFEKNYLIQLMEKTRGNITQAAKLAGKYRADFYKLLEKYQINPEKFRKN
ncbi:MAG TPA: sigma-54-dependent Fis family transcriptional regulator [Candidatus Desulfofervidus auxilii]|uniref:Sigma-54-dependent Fis family transcriptional regulator n=1 Tax=Desulfofervidus auxilii TaxID=1621989 RepID=A0A7V0NEH5_DESA2|nr:sigma-54-dependent Fis family transcriptional regulator [Candidatus Desulfofervidus auxilii]